MYRQKLSLVEQKGLADWYDLNNLSFAKFVCERKKLSYSDLACFAVLNSREFVKHAPPQ